jgi:hypothetical protein
MREASPDKEQFLTAVRVLREYVELGDRLPLHYTLPSGLSIEAVCDRLLATTGSVPRQVGQTVRRLAKELSVTTSKETSYHTYSVVLREIALRLTLPFDQRQAPLIREARWREAPEPTIRVIGLSG